MAKKDTFEHTLKQLESIVVELESGSLDLDKMLELFEKGIELTHSCQSQLKEAEVKIRTILQDGDKFIEKSGISSK